jgi:hypothetical protein
MSVLDPDVIDFVGTDRVTGEVVLTVSDHLEWHGRDEHLPALHSKLEAYLGFVRNGGLAQSYPDAAGRSVRIEIVYQYTPDPAGQAFLHIRRQELQAFNIALSYIPLPSKYQKTSEA